MAVRDGVWGGGRVFGDFQRVGQSDAARGWLDCEGSRQGAQPGFFCFLFLAVGGFGRLFLLWLHSVLCLALGCIVRRRAGLIFNTFHSLQSSLVFL